MDKLYGEDTESVIRTIEDQRGLAALAECPFLLASPEDIAGRIAKRLLTEAAFMPRISALSGNVETLLELCLAGAGACFCPEVLINRALPEQALSMLRIIRFGDLARYQIRLGWLRQPYYWQGILNFVDVASNAAVLPDRNEKETAASE